MEAFAGSLALAVDRNKLITSNVSKNDDGKWPQRMLGAITESTSEGLLITSRDGIALLVNPAAEKILGVREADVIGQRLHHVDRRLQAFNELRRDETLGRKRILLPSTDGGQDRVAGARISCFNYREIEYLLWSLSDETHDVELERRLSEQESRFSSLVENAPLGVFSCDTNGTITSTNSAVPTVLSIAPEEFVAGCHIESAPPLVESGISNNLQRCLKNGHPIVSDHDIFNNSGETTHLTVHHTPLHSQAGEPLGVQTIIEDTTEQEETRNSLMLSEERYRTFFQNAPISLWEADFSSVKNSLGALEHEEAIGQYLSLIHIVAVNPASVALFEAQTADAMIHAWPSFVALESYAEYIKLIIDLAGNKSTTRFETTNTTLRGNQMRLIVSAAVAPGYEHDLSKVLLSFIDITGIKQAEEALQDQLVLERLVTNISTRFVSLELDQVDKTVDRALADIGLAIGVDRALVTNLPPSMVHEWNADPSESFSEQYLQLSLEDFPWIASRFELQETIHFNSLDELPTEADSERKLFKRLGLKSCLIIPLVLQGKLKGLFSLSTIHSERKWPDKVISLLRIIADVITSALDRQQKEQNIRESEDLVHTVFHSMGSGVLLTNENDRTVLLANKAALENLRLSDSSQIIGHDLSTVVPGTGVMLRDVSLGAQQNVLLTLGNGSKRTIGFTSTLATSGQQRVIVFRDLTDIIQSGLRQKRSEQLARVGMMVAKLSHEIKNPLTSILLGLSSLETNATLSKDDEFILQSVLEEVRFLKTMIGGLLDSTRFQEVSPSYGPIDPIIKRCINSQVHLAAHKGVSLNTKEGPLGTKLHVDSKAMSRVLANLIQNALEACSRGDAVYVGWRLLNDREKQEKLPGYKHKVVCVFVDDNGPGMPAAVMENLFVPFTTTKTYGTGLGLSVVKEVAVGHGGVIEVHSGINENGQGTRFEILLPGGKRITCLSVVSNCSMRGNGSCPMPEGCPVHETSGYSTCWVHRSKASRQEAGTWAEECLSCEVFLAGNLEFAHRRNTRGQK
ncbi:MAG: PAS domain S-box protein [Deltaproteobacteria bacterium]|nr:PAS domain S-box protein [Deltaproteobacteria bacterium]